MAKQYNYKKRADGKNATGRPTTYKPEYCNMIIEYFSIPPQQVVYKETFYADGTPKSKEPITQAAQFPTMEGFAAEIGIHKDTLYEWVKVHNEFTVAFTRARQLQEKIWLVNGMGNLYNSQFAQFFGKNCLGYKDKQEVTVDQDKPFEVNIKIV